MGKIKSEWLENPLQAQRNQAAVKLDPQHIKAAETVLSKGDRVELIPIKDGIKVMRVRREEVKK